MKKVFFLALFASSISFNAQITETENTMLWTTLGVSKKINDKWSISYDQLHSLSLNDSRFNFIQPDLGISYELRKNLNLEIGYSPTFSLDSNTENQLLYHRVSADIKLRTKVSKRIRMKNSFTAEQHFTQRSKFQQRLYYRLDLYYRNTNLPWRLRPFINQKLYWYSNGRELQYYNDDGSLADLKSPNGLHAYRLKTGFKLYPTDDFIVSIYFQKQKEFNSSILGSSDINSLNPNSNDIRRAFYDFSVLGISCRYKL